MRGVLSRIGLSMLVWLSAFPTQAQEFVWAKQLGGGNPSFAAANSTTVDAGGSVYSVGIFTDTVDFDPGPGTVNLTAMAGDGFILKLDGAGSLVWVRALVGPGYVTPGCVAVDASGNVLVAGSFGNGTSDLDPGPGVFNVTQTGNSDGFVLKLDSAGNFIWAKRIGGGPGDEDPLALAVDAAGNVYTAGYFYQTGDFDPGPAVYNMTAQTHDAFFLKLDNAGSFVWAKQQAGSNVVAPARVVLDANDNVYAAGYFAGTADFDPGPGTLQLTSMSGGGAGFDPFVSKLDSSGGFVWAKQFAGTGDDTAFGVAVDGSGSVFAVGYFEATVDFDPGSGTFNMTPAGNLDAFVAKLDSSGNFSWAKRLGAADQDVASGVALDTSGSVYVAGTFQGTVDFDPGPGIHNLASASVTAIFVCKLDGAGGFASVAQIGGADAMDINDLFVDAARNVYTVGDFSGTMDFDPGPGTYNLTSVPGIGLYDGFISKLRSAGAGSVPDGGSVPGVPMTVGKVGSSLLLQWSPTCLSDADFEVYEGLLGSFTSHVPRLCSTGGATGAVVAPSGGNRYYLVVPTTGGVEGSYGKNRSGVERPPSATACVAQAFGSCP